MKTITHVRRPRKPFADRIHDRILRFIEKREAKARRPWIYMILPLAYFAVAVGLTWYNLEIQNVLDWVARDLMGLGRGAWRPFLSLITKHGIELGFMMLIHSPLFFGRGVWRSVRSWAKRRNQS